MKFVNVKWNEMKGKFEISECFENVKEDYSSAYLFMENSRILIDKKCLEKDEDGYKINGDYVLQPTLFEKISRIEDSEEDSYDIAVVIDAAGCPFKVGTVTEDDEYKPWVHSFFLDSTNKIDNLNEMPRIYHLKEGKTMRVMNDTDNCTAFSIINKFGDGFLYQF